MTNEESATLKEAQFLAVSALTINIIARHFEAKRGTSNENQRKILEQVINGLKEKAGEQVQTVLKLLSAVSPDARNEFINKIKVGV